MLKKINLILKKNLNWIKLCLALSVAWAVIASALYLIEIHYHQTNKMVPTTSQYGVYTVYSTRFDLFHDYFNWGTPKFTTMTFSGNADPEDLSGVGEKQRWCILKPEFSLVGFLKLILLPMLLVWMLGFIWTRRQKIFAKVMGLLKSTNNIHKYSFIGSVGFILLFITLHLLGALSFIDCTALVMLGVGYLVAAIVFILLSCLFVYGLCYSVVRGIGMAKKKNDK